MKRQEALKNGIFLSDVTKSSMKKLSTRFDEKF